MELLVLLETLLDTEVLELAFVADGSEETFAAGYVLLAVEADLEALLVIFEASVGAKLFDVGAEPYAVLAEAGGGHGGVARRAQAQLELVFG